MTKKNTLLANIIHSLTPNEKQQLNDYVTAEKQKEKDFRLTMKIENLTAKEKLLMMDEINKIAIKNKVKVKFGIE